MSYDLIIKNASVVTPNIDKLHLHNATIAIAERTIQKVTDEKSAQLTAKNIIDAEGALVTPGLIDCHTHLVYGGSRAHEFAMRLDGATYAEIAKSGGGILSTVKHTRQASFEALQKNALKRLYIMQQQGTTTAEIKSGYGLDLETEIKMLKVARSLETFLPTSIITTFLGAHAIPPEYHGQSDAYISFIIKTVLPKVMKENLADMLDAFCETIAFSPKQIAQLFDAAEEYNLPIKLHTEQLSNQQGATLAAKYGAHSVEHLEYLMDKDCINLAQSNTVAVILPGAFYFLQEQQKPPIAALREASVDMAIATDCNPGSSPFTSLPLMMNMACLLFGLTFEEAFKGVTVNAAKALGIEKKLGSIAVGKQADIILWNTTHAYDLAYNPTLCFANTLIKAGKIYPMQKKESTNYSAFIDDHSL